MGDFLHYVLAEEDTLDNAAIHLLNLSSGQSTVLHEGNTAYERVTFSPKSRYLAFLSTNDSAKSKKPYYNLFLTTTSNPKVEEIATRNSQGILENGRISNDGSIRF